ncbi:Alpha/Beta hydrolase protein [Boletus edulis BED1]|uniref:Alpha/Beta hydrolase protein n=1 Tax=Boletus edulis BED1 TaxID=1328754 RepID=A0AAD4BQ75_BOLED|nr:Alpha/Beta hydrolase protein [Boletus edulis BED1]
MLIPGLITQRLRSDDGTEIYAEALGNPSLPSILFQDRTLLSHAYLVRYDLRGHGWSGKPLDDEGNESIRYAQDFMAVAAAFNLNKPYLFGWSFGATIATDLCQHINPAPLSGIIYAAPLPYIGLFMKNLGKPEIAPVREALMAPDVATVMDSKIKFVRSTFLDPDVVDYPTVAAWVGAGTYISGEGIRRAITRPQDPAGLFAAGKAGLPLLVLVPEEEGRIRHLCVGNGRSLYAW